MSLDRKTNHVDFFWYVIHTLPHQEEKLAAILKTEQKKRPNILEVFCPMSKVVRVQRNGKEVRIPYFANYVFVLATEHTLAEFLTEKYPDGYLVYDKCFGKVMTIPEVQMRLFMDFDVHYPEDVLVLERPYTDYAFNPKTNEPNDAIIVTDGPFKGIIGYFVRFRGNRRLVFQMKNYKEDSCNKHKMDLVLSIPDIWDYPIKRLHNAKQDKFSQATRTSRTIDYFLGKMQASGIVDDTLAKFVSMLGTLLVHPSLRDFCNHEKDAAFRNMIRQLSPNEATELMTLVQYLKTDPQWIEDNWKHEVIRPFLTDTAFGGPMDKEYEVVRHRDCTEIVCQVNMSEPTFFSETNTSADCDITYYAHVGLVSLNSGKSLLFIDWTQLLQEYFLMKGTALAKQNETFRTYCPTFYNVLAHQTEVEVVKDFKLANKTIHVLGIKLDGDVTEAEDVMAHSVIAQNIKRLIDTGGTICSEINSSTHLALWRRYLRTVWLHR